jgi:hypothetical protein
MWRPVMISENSVLSIAVSGTTSARASWRGSHADTAT